jgi:hypothetical protein
MKRPKRKAVKKKVAGQRVAKKSVVKKKKKPKQILPAMDVAPRLGWKPLEEALRKLCERTVTEHAKKHPKDVYYALFIDFAADWTQLRLHLNTPFHLRRRAEQYIHANPELYARRSVESVANDIRWEPGDFGYFEINNTPTWKRNWSKFAKLLKAAAAKQDAETYASGEFVELKFLLTVTRVLLQLERDGLHSVPKTRGFRVCCMRPEERAEDAWRRMELVRQQLNAESAARR